MADNVFTRYRVVVVTAIIGVAGVLRVAKPEWLVPADEDIVLWVDAALVTLGPVAWLLAFRAADTVTDSLEG
jgi:hypothetical protein